MAGAASENLVLGVARLVLCLPGCRSLKEKRRVLASLRDRLRSRHNVSVGEIGAQDEHGRIVLALALVGSDGRQVESALQGILGEVEATAPVPLVERTLEVEVWGDALAGRRMEYPERF